MQLIRVERRTLIGRKSRSFITEPRLDFTLILEDWKSTILTDIDLLASLT